MSKSLWGGVDALKKKGLGIMLGGTLDFSPTNSASARRVCGHSPASASRLQLECDFLSQSRAQVCF